MTQDLDALIKNANAWQKRYDAEIPICELLDAITALRAENERLKQEVVDCARNLAEKLWCKTCGEDAGEVVCKSCATFPFQTEKERLRKTLTFYHNQLCDEGPRSEVCGQFEFGDCAGCEAAKALKGEA